MNVLFDLDGTLTDPREGIVACFKHALHGLGYCPPPDSDLECYIGPPLQECFALLLRSESPEQIDAAVNLYRQRFSAKGIFENAVYPGVHDALAELRTGGARLYIATSNLMCSRNASSTILVSDPIFKTRAQKLYDARGYIKDEEFYHYALRLQ